jgi:Hint module
VDSAKLASATGLTTNKNCFAGSETVRLEHGEAKLISAVRAGDIVLSADSDGQTFFSEVVFVPHGPNNQRSLFTHISTAAGSSVKMTASHIIPAGSCGSSASLPLVYASKVRVGDCIMTVSGEETVSAVETVRGEGLYTIVTKAEYLVVNGIIASPFAFNHVAANLFYNVHRFLYASIPHAVKSPRFSRVNEVRYALLSDVRDPSLFYLCHHILCISFFLSLRAQHSMTSLREVFHFNLSFDLNSSQLTSQALGLLLPAIGYQT